MKLTTGIQAIGRAVGPIVSVAPLVLGLHSGSGPISLTSISLKKWGSFLPHFELTSS
jgi:hypothetical protein